MDQVVACDPDHTGIAPLPVGAGKELPPESPDQHAVATDTPLRRLRADPNDMPAVSGDGDGCVSANTTVRPRRVNNIQTHASARKLTNFVGACEDRKEAHNGSTTWVCSRGRSDQDSPRTAASHAPPSGTTPISVNDDIRQTEAIDALLGSDSSGILDFTWLLINARPVCRPLYRPRRPLVSAKKTIQIHDHRGARAHDLCPVSLHGTRPLIGHREYR